MRKVFLDCGTHELEGFEELYKRCGLDESWEVFCFEVVEELIPKIQEKTLFKTLPNIEVINKAVWTEDGKMPLTLDLQFDDMYDYGGATNILGDNYLKPDYIKHELRKNAREVETLDFSKFVRENFSKEDQIIVKLDIEGAEYEVLDKMINEGTVDYVNAFFVEWHNHMLDKKYDENYLRRQLAQRNIPLYYWH